MSMWDDVPGMFDGLPAQVRAADLAARQYDEARAYGANPYTSRGMAQRAMGGLGYVASSLDKPGAAVRGVLAGRPDQLGQLIPFSDAMGITDYDEATSGWDLVEQYTGHKNKPGIFNDPADAIGDIAGLGVELITDPLNIVGAGVLTKGVGKGAEALSLFGKPGTNTIKSATEGLQRATAETLAYREARTAAGTAKTNAKTAVEHAAADQAIKDAEELIARAEKQQKRWSDAADAGTQPLATAWSEQIANKQSSLLDVGVPFPLSLVTPESWNHIPVGQGAKSQAIAAQYDKAMDYIGKSGPAVWAKSAFTHSGSGLPTHEAQQVNEAAIRGTEYGSREMNKYGVDVLKNKNAIEEQRMAELAGQTPAAPAAPPPPAAPTVNPSMMPNPEDEASQSLEEMIEADPFAANKTIVRGREQPGEGPRSITLRGVTNKVADDRPDPFDIPMISDADATWDNILQDRIRLQGQQLDPRREPGSPPIEGWTYPDKATPLSSDTLDYLDEPAEVDYLTGSMFRKSADDSPLMADLKDLRGDVAGGPELPEYQPRPSTANDTASLINQDRAMEGLDQRPNASSIPEDESGGDVDNLLEANGYSLTDDESRNGLRIKTSVGTTPVDIPKKRIALALDMLKEQLELDDLKELKISLGKLIAEDSELPAEMLSAFAAKKFQAEPNGWMSYAGDLGAITSFEIKHALVAAEKEWSASRTGPDWRPDQMTPEDYYSYSLMDESEQPLIKKYLAERVFPVGRSEKVTQEDLLRTMYNDDFSMDTLEEVADFKTFANEFSNKRLQDFLTKKLTKFDQAKEAAAEKAARGEVELTEVERALQDINLAHGMAKRKNVTPEGAKNIMEGKGRSQSAKKTRGAMDVGAKMIQDKFIGLHPDDLAVLKSAAETSDIALQEAYGVLMRQNTENLAARNIGKTEIKGTVQLGGHADEVAAGSTERAASLKLAGPQGANPENYWKVVREVLTSKADDATAPKIEAPKLEAPRKTEAKPKAEPKPKAEGKKAPAAKPLPPEEGGPIVDLNPKPEVKPELKVESTPTKPKTVTLYHGGDLSKEGATSVHAGTKEAAAHSTAGRAGTGFEMQVDVGKSATMSDSGRAHTPSRIAEDIISSNPNQIDGNLPAVLKKIEETKGIEAADKALWDVLKRKGFDSIEYKNVNEDAGSLSYIFPKEKIISRKDTVLRGDAKPAPAPAPEPIPKPEAAKIAIPEEFATQKEGDDFLKKNRKLLTPEQSDEVMGKIRKAGNKEVQTANVEAIKARGGDIRQTPVEEEIVHAPEPAAAAPAFQPITKKDLKSVTPADIAAWKKSGSGDGKDIVAAQNKELQSTLKTGGTMPENWLYPEDRERAAAFAWKRGKGEVAAPAPKEAPAPAAKPTKPAIAKTPEVEKVADEFFDGVPEREYTRPKNVPGRIWDEFIEAASHSPNLKGREAQATHMALTAYAPLVESAALLSGKKVDDIWRDLTVRHQTQAEVAAKYGDLGSSGKLLGVHEMIGKAKKYITLTENAEDVTLIHELGHFLRGYLPDNDLRTIAAWAARDAKKTDDLFNAFKNGLPHDASDELKDLLYRGEENFTQVIEDYFQRGISPAPELKPILERLKEAYTAIIKKYTAYFKDYRTLTPPMREMLDRLSRPDKIEAAITGGKKIDAPTPKQAADAPAAAEATKPIPAPTAAVPTTEPVVPAKTGMKGSPKPAKGIEKWAEDPAKTKRIAELQQKYKDSTDAGEMHAAAAELESLGVKMTNFGKTEKPAAGSGKPPGKKPPAGEKKPVDGGGKKPPDPPINENGAIEDAVPPEKIGMARAWRMLAENVITDKQLDEAFGSQKHKAVRLVQDLRDKLEEVNKRKKALGLKTDENDLQDALVKYFPRYSPNAYEAKRSYWKDFMDIVSVKLNSKKPHYVKGKTLAGTRTPDAGGRNDAYKGWRLGAEGVNDAAKKWASEPVSDAMIADLKKNVTQGADEADDVYLERINDVAKHFSRLSSFVKKDGIFTRDIVNDMHTHLQYANRQLNSAEALHRLFATTASKTGGDKMVSLFDAFKQTMPNSVTAAEKATTKKAAKAAAISDEVMATFFNGNPDVMKRLGIKNTDDLKGLYVPEAAVNASKRIMDFHAKPEMWPEIQPIIEFTDNVREFIKKTLTLPFAAFHARNLGSGMFVNAMAGAFDPASIRQSMRLWSGEGLSATDKALLEEIKIYGVIDTSKGMRGYGATAMPQQTYDLGDDLVMETGGMKGEYKRQMDHLNKEGGDVGIIGSTLRKGQAAGQTVASATEFINRASHYIALRKKGWSQYAAAQSVEAVHHNYGKLSRFENNVMQRLTAFYTFSRKNAGYMIDQILDTRGPMNKIIRASAQMKEDAEIPEYMGGTTAIPIGGPDEDGNQRLISGFGLPYEEAFERYKDTAGETVDAHISMLNPLIKIPLEGVAGRQMFSGRNLDDLYGGITGTPALDNAIYNSPAARFISTGRTIMDERKGPIAKAINLATGVKLTDVDVEKQRRIKERNELIEKLKGSENIKGTTIYGKRKDVELSPEEESLLKEYRKPR